MAVSAVLTSGCHKEDGYYKQPLQHNWIYIVNVRWMWRICSNTGGIKILNTDRHLSENQWTILELNVWIISLYDDNNISCLHNLFFWNNTLQTMNRLANTSTCMKCGWMDWFSGSFIWHSYGGPLELLVEWIEWMHNLIRIADRL